MIPDEEVGTQRNGEIYEQILCERFTVLTEIFAKYKHNVALLLESVDGVEFIIEESNTWLIYVFPSLNSVYKNWPHEYDPEYVL